MRRVLTALLLLLAAGAAAAVFSPWPGVLVIRAVFERGAAEASARLEKHVPDGITTTTHVYDPADPDAVLDIYRPVQTGPGAPLVVWVHGGGFVSGSRQDVANYLKILASEGFAVVNVGYSIAPGATYPTPVRQLNAALGFLDREADMLGIGADRIVLAGDSAGAQIAAQTAALITGPDYARMLGLAPMIAPERLAGVMFFCGVYDLPAGGTGSLPLDLFLHVTAWAYSGTPRWRQDARFATISVIPNLTPAFPPAFISVGNADPLAPQSVALADALNALGTDVTTLFFPDDRDPPLGHEYQFNLDTDAGRQALSRTAAWLKEL